MCGTKLSQHTPSHRMCGTKLSQHTPSHRMCGTKLSQHEPHGPTSGRKLSLFTRNGSIWRFFYMQGEFCTVVTAKKLSRENFVPNVRQSWGSPTGHQAPPVWRVPEGPVWRARAGFEAQSLAAVPVDNGAWPQYPQTTGVPSPSKFRMQFPHDTNRCTLKNRRISTIRLQHLKYTQGNCMRNCRNPVRTQHHATIRPHGYGERRRDRCGGRGRVSRHRAWPQCRWSVAGPGRGGSSPVEWCNRFVSFGVGYALSWSGGSSCWVGWGVSRDLVRMSRLR